MNRSLMIGVIIPAYNVEKYIFRAIESCIGQTYSNIEVVIVDDGSSDATSDIVKSYADKDERVKLYRQENGGVSSARNRALDMCTADYAMNFSPEDPTVPNSRYVTEDVPQGLVLLESLGISLNIPTPTCSALIDIASASLMIDFRVCGRTIDKLGRQNLLRIQNDHHYFLNWQNDNA